MKNLILISLFIFGLQSQAAQRNLIAVGQGIVSPSVTTNLIISNGFTSENPTGIAYQNGFRISGEFDTANNNNNMTNNDGMGAELGVGNGDMGLAFGYYKEDCTDCEGDVYGGFGILLGDFLGFGVSGQEELYNAGVIFNPKGSMRFGVTASLFNLDGDNNNITTFGAGVAYYGQAWSFSVDASKRAYENDTIKDDTIKITPGLKMNIEKIHFSFNIDTYNNEPEGTNTDSNAWFGLGYGHGEPFNITLYHDYTKEWTFVLSMFF
ncbi:MAG: hypothetical protein KDD40_08180 [Bdellovibrionales bacterium]|nr:hypothetical protein [Bdellovibrionales bacterium]